jgi:hypothetical protein
MLLPGRDIAVGRLRNVVHPQQQVLFRGDAFGARHEMEVAQQRHHVTGAGFLDGAVQTGQRADVNHAPL